MKDSFQYKVRIPQELKESLAKNAENDKRSINSEILIRLENSLITDEKVSKYEKLIEVMRETSSDFKNEIWNRALEYYQKSFPETLIKAAGELFSSDVNIQELDEDITKTLAESKLARKMATMFVNNLMDVIEKKN